MNTGELGTDNAWVLSWQRKFHRWAQTNKNQKYGDIYNLVCDLRTLRMAWQRVKTNRGSQTAGVDGQTRRRVEERLGEARFLQEIHAELKTGVYRPQPVREKGIPKANGKIRYLGIPTLKDRVVQQALRTVLEPIFEADFYVSSYAYRPGRRAQDAIEEIFHFLKPTIGYSWVVEGDIQGCFDNVHHGILMEEIQKRVTDHKVLRLIRVFLKAGIMTELGKLCRSITGTPQGGIFSPLAANIYLSRLDRHFQEKWQSYGSATRRHKLRKKGLATCYMIRYADDFLILVKGSQQQAQDIKEETAQLLRKELRMELSWEKTKITPVSEGFDFLGHHIVVKANRTEQVGVRVYPSQKALKKVKQKVKDLTSKSTTALSLANVLGQLNPVLRGWSGYFRFAHSKRTFGYLDYYTWWRLFRWMRKKHHRLSAKTLVRKHIPDWIFREDNQTFFRPRAVKVLRYKYRGNHIPTPWNQEDGRLKLKHPGARLPEELRLMESLEVNCTR